MANSISNKFRLYEYWLESSPVINIPDCNGIFTTLMIRMGDSTNITALNFFVLDYQLQKLNHDWLG